jgi:hypothetical protein
MCDRQALIFSPILRTRFLEILASSGAKIAENSKLENITA